MVVLVPALALLASSCSRGVATDLIFSVASVFAPDKTATGWEEIT